MRLEAIEIVEDRSSESRCDEGFLKVARLVLRNVYDDGSRSAPYPCDIVSRPGSDAVVAVLYEIDGSRRVHILLRESPRAPVYLRHRKTFVHPDPRRYLSIQEVVAGLVEPKDNPLIKACKDAGSAAVAVAGLAGGAAWLFALYSLL